MHAHEIRELTNQDILKELEGSYREVINIRLRLATKQLSNTSQLRAVKKNIARLKTIIGERQMRGG
jgi:large subunit ribosomal protein L29